jgi:hypothetical protein
MQSQRQLLQRPLSGFLGSLPKALWTMTSVVRVDQDHVYVQRSVLVPIHGRVYPRHLWVTTTQETAVQLDLQEDRRAWLVKAKVEGVDFG